MPFLKKTEICGSFKGHDYKRLKEKLLRTGQLFIDPEFPPNYSSLFRSPKTAVDIEWRRPGQIVESPSLFDGGVSCDGVVQGALGNCWFVAICSTINHDKHVRSKQEFSKNYCGIFHFRFYRFGGWVDVVVDDLLPVRQGELLFAHSRTKNEFWCCLLEKAFAKLKGCYESLIGVSVADALVDISGGLLEVIDLSTYSDDCRFTKQLFYDMRDALEENALITALIPVTLREDMETALDCGLVKGHAYAVTGTKTINDMSRNKYGHLFRNDDQCLMFSFRDPWRTKQWKGAWANGASEWQLISKELQDAFGLKLKDDGEFWYLKEVCICRQTSTTGVFHSGSKYRETLFYGSWETFVREDIRHPTGGEVTFPQTVIGKPQYRFDVTDRSGFVLFCLTQKDIQDAKQFQTEYTGFGIFVMKVENNRMHRLHLPMLTVGVSDFVNARSVALRLRNLPTGRYVVVPSTFTSSHEGDFLMRIYSTHNLTVSELREQYPSMSSFSCLSVGPSAVYRIAFKVLSDVGTDIKQSYCVVKCEEQKVRSPLFHSLETDFELDFSVVFFRKRLDRPIIIDVFNSCPVRDKFVGRVIVPETSLDSIETLFIPVMGSGNRSNTRRGKLKLEVTASKNIVAL